ncbi:hypothetical protein B0H67DRAFT_574362 [Lasiosphaeris hirsuta]|uniref:Altered inheritance of mitochondria protein 6 n=1 Tax=Lasiosphaeris hirsuta TaxID=260670 RepID=A0AA40APY0_9PEZI|nr:hypothetical protein B0H67DRAFT_574362 [Lasiosphaeris hirsuta]
MPPLAGASVCRPDPSDLAQIPLLPILSSTFTSTSHFESEARPSRFLSALRYIMPRGETKSLLVKKNAYAPVPNNLEDGDISITGPRDAQQAARLYSCATVFSLTVLALLLGLGIGPYIHRNILGNCHAERNSGDEDPLAKWGEPGTGTEDIAWYPTDFLRDVIPVACHSHNDYWRKVPLFSAVYAGCTGVEADVWLRKQDLLVGHDTAALQPNRTFLSLYVNPLVKILERQNPSTEYYNAKRRGVFDTDPDQTLVLLVDLKTNGAETWPLVLKQLDPLRERGWLTYVQDGDIHHGPITVVGTGNTPFDQIIANSTYRDTFFDAPLDHLDNSTFDSINSYYASTSLWASIGNVWFRGGPNDDQLAKIRKHLQEAHRRGLKARYWELPPWPIHTRNRVWEVLMQEGVDMLNVDDLDGATKGDWTKPKSF